MDSSNDEVLFVGTADAEHVNVSEGDLAYKRKK